VPLIRHWFGSPTRSTPCTARPSRSSLPSSSGARTASPSNSPMEGSCQCPSAGRTTGRPIRTSRSVRAGRASEWRICWPWRRWSLPGGRH